MEHTYKMLLRPASFCTLPRGVKWDYVQAPWSLAHRRLDIPRASNEHGIISTDRRLTEQERADFDLEVV